MEHVYEKRIVRDKVKDKQYLIFILKENIDEIVASQGFIKDKELVLKIINYFNRSFVPKKVAGKFYKPANKLLLSLQLYCEKIFKTGLYIKGRYKNLFTDYKFLQVIPKDVDSHQYLQCTNIPEVTSSYHEREIFVRGNIADLSRGGVGRNYSLFKSKPYFQRIKKVDKDQTFNVKLKKNYTTLNDKYKDLYKIYLNWLVSKKRSGEIYWELRFEREMLLPTETIPTCRNVRFIRYYLSFDKFVKYLNTDIGNLPKRFSRIMKFCQCLNKNENPRNNTVVESIVASTLVRNKSNELVSRDDLIVKISQKFLKWYESIFDDLVAKGYLVNEEKGQMKLYNDANFITSRISFYPDASLKRKINKVRNSLRSKILKYITNKYLEKPQEIEVVKEKVIKAIQMKYFVTRLRKNLKPYLKYEDNEKIGEINKGDKIPLSMLELRDKYGINLKEPLHDDDDLDEMFKEDKTFWAVVAAKVFYKQYSRNKDKCSKCKNYTCGQHIEQLKSMITQEIKNRDPKINKKTLKKQADILTTYCFKITFAETY